MCASQKLQTLLLCLVRFSATQTLTLFLTGVVSWRSYKGWFRPHLIGIGLIKLCFSHLLHSDLRLLIIVWFTTKMIFFYCDFLMKIINLYLSNFKMTNSFILDFHEVGISYFPGRGRPYTVLSQNHWFLNPPPPCHLFFK